MPRNLGLSRSYNVFRAEAEFLKQLLDGSRGAKTLDTDVVPIGTGVNKSSMAWASTLTALTLVGPNSLRRCSSLARARWGSNSRPSQS